MGTNAGNWRPLGPPLLLRLCVLCVASQTLEKEKALLAPTYRVIYGAFISACSTMPCWSHAYTRLTDILIIWFFCFHSASRSHLWLHYILSISCWMQPPISLILWFTCTFAWEQIGRWRRLQASTEAVMWRTEAFMTRALKETKNNAFKKTECAAMWLDDEVRCNWPGDDIKMYHWLCKR